MAVYTVTKSYHTKGNMGMIDVTGDFQAAVDKSPVLQQAVVRR